MGKDKLICITKNDWHYKLIKFTWGIDPSMFKNLCPYFWLTIASIFCCLPVSVYKALKWGWTWFENYNRECYTRRMSRSQIFYQYLWLTDSPDTYKANGLNYFKESKEKTRVYNLNLTDFCKKVGYSEKEIKTFKRYYEQKVNQEILRERQKEEKERLKEIKKEKIKTKSKETVYFISNLFKRIFQVFLILCCYLFGSILCSMLTTFFCWSIYTSKIGNICLWVFGIIIALVLSFVFTSLCVKYENNWKSNLKQLSPREYIFVIPFMVVYIPLKIVLMYIIWGFVYYIIYRFLWSILIVGIVLGFKQGIVEFTGIFGEYLDSSYSDYCPTINWKDKK